MNNAELIAKIKAEIERLKSIEYPCDNSQQETGFFNALDRMTDFLSTLESEKPMNPEDAMKELDEKIALVKQRGTWDGVDVDKYMDEVRGREPEKPMNQEGLEEEINRLWESFADEMEGPHNLFDIYARLARHFANWQKEQMMKEAVEGKIIFLLNGDVAVNIGDTDEYKLGQKVRIIIVKE